MALTHVTAHYLRRAADSAATLSLRQEPLALDQHKEQLLDQLKSSFLARLGRQHGSFAEALGEAQPSVLVRELEAFLANERSFSQLSVALMRALEQAVNEMAVEVNAHFLFFIEQTSEHHHVFYLFIVNQNESLAISDALEVTPSYFIDTGPSLSGLKVDLAEWRERKNYAYLTLLTPRGNALLAEVIEQLSGFGNGLNKEEATLTFLEGVESFAKQVPEEKVNDYRASVVDYCMAQEKSDAPVKVAELSKALEGIDASEFEREMRAYSPGENEEIRVDRRSLRRYVKFSGRDKDLAISFSTFHLHTRIDYDEESDTLVIRGIPAGLRKQLLAHLGL
ncbi:MAG TPA: hypothetical protein ENK35_01990 [Candidatus Tenderia sp.]|nr:hypothetical protein [Candidatus Tenderia sp.]